MSDVNKVTVGTRGKDGKIQVFRVEADSVDDARSQIIEAMKEDEKVESPVALALINCVAKDEIIDQPPTKVA